MKLNKRKLTLFLILFAVILATIYVYKDRLLERSITCTGGESFEKRIPCKLFRQIDDKWSDEKIGGSGETIGAVGCTLCCVSMSLNSFQNSINPKYMNELLIKNDGYTKNGYIIWSKVKDVSPVKIKISISNNPSHKEIDTNIKNNIPVIAKIYINNQIGHWILITGKSGQDYLMHDPLGSAAGYELLSKYKSNISRTRCLHPSD